MQLSEGALVEIQPVLAPSEQPRPQVSYATVQEALQAFEETLPQHEAAYRELAK